MDIMNILFANAMLILTLLILIVSIIMGAIRGFIKTFFSAFAVIVALIIAVQTGPYVGKVIQHTPIYSGIAGHIEENMNTQTEFMSEKVSDQIDTIAGYPIPEFIKETLIENNNSQMYEALGVYDFNAYVAAYMACLVINAVSFLVVFLLAFVIIKMIEGALNLVSKLPVLRSINKAGGIVCGVVHGLIRIWLIGVFVMAFAWTSIGQWASVQINGNPILSLLYNHNLIVSALTNMSKMLF